MDSIIFFSEKELNTILRRRSGECKLGETVIIPNENDSILKQLKNKSVKFVLLGIPEDIGVRANYGRGGAHTCWQPALESILNIQDNSFLLGKNILVLGRVETDDLMSQAKDLQAKNEKDIGKLRKLVETIDERVSGIVQRIAEAGKIPIVIGGGHNNSYPILKGMFRGINKEKGLNAINCDAHTDFRDTEGRHSGNGFTYAYKENFLNRYACIGIHESYNAENTLKKFKENSERLNFCTYEDIFIREKLSFANAIKNGIEFCKDSITGIEIDLDSITNVPSSARTSSGISPVQARQFIHACAHQCKVAYLHIAEGAPVLAHIKADNKTGKLIAYLVADFIKAQLERKS